MKKKFIAINELEPGMIIGEEVADDKGRTMIHEGVRLTPMYIKRLTKWEIEKVCILHEPGSDEYQVTEADEESSDEPSEEEQEFIQRVTDGVTYRFRTLDDADPLVKDMKALAIKYLIESGRGAIPGL